MTSFVSVSLLVIKGAGVRTWPQPGANCVVMGGTISSRGLAEGSEITRVTGNDLEGTGGTPAPFCFSLLSAASKGTGFPCQAHPP